MRKVQIRTILGSFYAKSEYGTNSHFAHNMSYQIYGAVCSIQTHKWVVMVILVRERRRRGEGLAWGWATKNQKVPLVAKVSHMRPKSTASNQNEQQETKQYHKRPKSTTCSCHDEPHETKCTTSNQTVPQLTKLYQNYSNGIPQRPYIVHREQSDHKCH